MMVGRLPSFQEDLFSGGGAVKFPGSKAQEICTTWDVENPVNIGINHVAQLVQDFV